MVRTFSIAESAPLLGVSGTTVSRHLPGGRARRGKRANLNLQEVVDLASRVQVDPELVRQRAERAEHFGPRMPAEAAVWAEIAHDLGLMAALAWHVNRIPADLAERIRVEPVPFDIPRPSPDTGNWQPLTPELLDELLPPGRE